MSRKKVLVPDSTPVVFDSRLKMYVRPATTDRDTAGLVKPYTVLPIKRGDIVLDLGGNIGFAVQLFLAMGAGLVISVEPDPTNFQILQRNCRRFGNQAVLINAAVVADDRTTCRLYLNPNKGKDGHSTMPFTRREWVDVPAVSYATLCRRFEFHHLKVDIEGEEHNIFRAGKIPSTVRSAMMEIHLTKSDWRTAGAGAIDRNFLSQGFGHIKPPKFTPKSWHCLAAWQRS